MIKIRRSKTGIDAISNKDIKRQVSRPQNFNSTSAIRRSVIGLWDVFTYHVYLETLKRGTCTIVAERVSGAPQLRLTSCDGKMTGGLYDPLGIAQALLRSGIERITFSEGVEGCNIENVITSLLSRENFTRLEPCGLFALEEIFIEKLDPSGLPIFPGVSYQKTGSECKMQTVRHGGQYQNNSDIRESIITKCKNSRNAEDMLDVISGIYLDDSFKRYISRILTVKIKDSLHKESDLERAIQLFPRDVYFRTMLLDLYVKRDDEARALEVFETMKKDGVAPSKITYAALINLYVTKGDEKMADKLLIQMKTGGIKPDRYTYNSLINLHVKSGDEKKAREVFEMMKADNIAPNKIAYTVLINLYIHRKEEEKAWGIFLTMRNDHIDPDEVTYRVLSLFLNNREKLEKLSDILREEGNKSLYCIVLYRLRRYEELLAVPEGSTNDELIKIAALRHLQRFGEALKKIEMIEAKGPDKMFDMRRITIEKGYLFLGLMRSTKDKRWFKLSKAEFLRAMDMTMGHPELSSRIICGLIFLKDEIKIFDRDLAAEIEIRPQYVEYLRGRLKARITREENEHIRMALLCLV